MRPVTLSYLADAATATGHPVAAAVYEQLGPWSGRAVSAAGLACYGSADRYLGRLAAVSGQPGVALRHLEAAVAFDEAAGWELWALRSRLALGRQLLSVGRRADVERAIPMVKEVQQSAHGRGLAGLALRCTELLASEEARAVREAPGSAPVGGSIGLTARETDILRLIAGGRTNREVGRLLHTSQHTVANQVHAILVKSGCANRAEAIAWAHRHHLLD
jgi:DNA-binding CsgD family transcriptional regulator